MRLMNLKTNLNFKVNDSVSNGTKSNKQMATHASNFSVPETKVVFLEKRKYNSGSLKMVPSNLFFIKQITKY